MHNPWVVNASPIISLGNIGRLDLLGNLSDHLIAPAAVVQEISEATDAASIAFLQSRWFNTVHGIIPELTVAQWGLGPGETEVLSYALQNPGVEAVLDDKLARRCALVLGVPARGTIGIILLAKQQGIIPSASEVLGELRANGLYVIGILSQPGFTACRGSRMTRDNGKRVSIPWL